MKLRLLAAAALLAGLAACADSPTAAPKGDAPTMRAVKVLDAKGDTTTIYVTSTNGAPGDETPTCPDTLVWRDGACRGPTVGSGGG